MYLSPLTDNLSSLDFGGKASGLSRINLSGLKMPEGYAVSRHAEKIYRSERKFPHELINELKEIIPFPGDQKVIIRSSAIGEDGEKYSFAGQLDSFVVGNDLDSVISGVKNCWDSLSNARVKSYQKMSGNELKEMGVVIQQFITAEYSGVLFTKSPFNKQQIYAEYVKGGAAQLVSGEVMPCSFSAVGSSITGNPQLPFDPKILLENALHLKKDFKEDLDIEWLYCAKQFFFVQARPVSTGHRQKVCWTNTNLNENYPHPISPLLYSIARDSYYHYFKNLSKLVLLNEKSIRLLEYDFSNSVGIFGNRIYYNMTSIHNILGASPYHLYFQDAFNKFVGYQGNDASSAKVIKKPSLLRLIIRLLYLNITLKSHVRKIESQVNEFAVKVTAAKDIKRLAQLFYEFLDLRFNQWHHASLADLFSMIHYKGLSVLLKRYGGMGQAGIHNKLIMAIPGLITNMPMIESWRILTEIESIPGGKIFFLQNDSKVILAHIRSNTEWGEVKRLIDDYLEKWGFRCSGELEFETENYIEAPWKFIELLKTYVQNGQEDPQTSLAKMDRERRLMMKKMIKAIFRRRHIFFPVSIIESGILLLMTDLCRSAIFKRESVRYQQALMYYNFKKIIFSIGAFLKAGDIVDSEKDILFLNYKEVGSLLSSSDMFAGTYREVISVRKIEYEKESALTFPVSFETVFGERRSKTDFNYKICEGNEFKGLAASGGKIRSKVKILQSVFEAGKIKPGEILVARQTDPGWAVIFPLIGGLIVERGGALSHGAIVAREFGIPCVTGIEGITEKLKDNDEVILDGDEGKIKIL